jgi:Zn-dependent protease
MKASINLGRIWGIPIGLHYSWFLVFGLITLSLGTGYFSNINPNLPGPANLLLGLVTSLLFFGSVLAHELGHSFVALRERIPVRGITLFIFGGVAQIEQEPRSPGGEFRIAIAGPLTSLGLGILFGALWLAAPASSLVDAPAMYLARINLILAVFNLIPGFPLDGGRVLRALVWWWTRSYSRATRLATFSGQLVAYGFIGFGALSMLFGGFSNGLWLIFIGWFLQNAASSAAYQLKVQEKLSGVTVSQAMSQDCASLPGLTTLNQIVQNNVLINGQHCFYVADSFDGVRGMLNLQDITRVPQAKWRFTTAEQIMTPFSRLLRIDPSMDLLAALQAMEAAQINQAPVVQGERLVGTLSRERVLQYLRLRTQHGV